MGILIDAFARAGLLDENQNLKIYADSIAISCVAGHAPRVHVVARRADADIGPRDAVGDIRFAATRTADPMELEPEIIRLAYVWGALDMRRLVFSPLPAGTDPYEIGRGLTNTFLDCPYRLEDLPMDGVIPVAKDSRAEDNFKSIEDQIHTRKFSPEKIIGAAAKYGYVAWNFKPCANGPDTFLQIWRKKDHSLNPSGGRDEIARIPSLPFDPAREPGKCTEALYRFTRGPGRPGKL